MPSRPEDLAGVADVDLAGRTALVTGATSGVGAETALALARLGADVLVHGRDRAAGSAVVREARDAGVDATFLPADFADPDAVDALATAVREDVDSLDLLVHNAGAHFDEGALVDAGAERAERTFVVNHLGPFRLSFDLREVLAPDARVVVVASAVHGRADGTFDVRSVDEYDGLGAYARSKLANVLFARELADRLDGAAVASCHPGFVPGSGLWREASVPVRVAVGGLDRLPSRLTPDVVDDAAEAAATSVYLAAAPEAADAAGGYYVDCARVDPADVARDGDRGSTLWDLSEDLTGVRW
ncbi:SDR family NAD(P)-dependent oxidoreductase [Halorarum halophilum]|uniref:SDR family NAD(P)-dependent oxidoreductase n=1 Tax=Halorarum halophilum TaxID=2743090 RepID=A0A7D5GWU5_9EURY|nr:SDR family NAD(P)-dependent oxidoreductase [Halobaculum halophilum]QLG27209.1 SDR family NAD(P)-dependent oxidoreductase [Halobaculum halophilum]